MSSPRDSFTFNLWTEPWIDVTGLTGRQGRLGIRDCLARAFEIAALTDASPLVAASLQRLLAAIVQDIYRPRNLAELAALIRRQTFEPADIDGFGSRYAHRFDLFSPDEPFLQTSDIARLLPKRKSDAKTVGYFFPEEPTATNINHFFHRYDDDSRYAPATAAQGLVTQALFASSGGAGIRPSINGVPPLYVLPAGHSLFETLALSIITSGFQPRSASGDDHPAWARESVISRGKEVMAVGYLESVTFPARRVRLFPEATSGRCSRSGEWSDVLVRRMVYEMGHARPKGAEAWLDPFAAYRFRGKEEPVPIRPQEGKMLWREYGNLFHTIAADDAGEAKAGTTMAPAVVQQIAALQDYDVGPRQLWHFRCVGMRTDMKAKVFEWVDETLDVPVGLLADPSAQADAAEAVSRAEECNQLVAGIHRRVYGSAGGGFNAVRQRIARAYWIRLAPSFRGYVLVAAERARRAESLREWSAQVLEAGEQVLSDGADEAGARGERLLERADALNSYRKARARKWKEWCA